MFRPKHGNRWWRWRMHCKNFAMLSPVRVQNGVQLQCVLPFSVRWFVLRGICFALCFPHNSIGFLGNASVVNDAHPYLFLFVQSLRESDLDPLLLFTYHDPAISSFIWFCVCVRFIHTFNQCTRIQWWIHKISITKESNEAEISQSNDYEICEADSDAGWKCWRQCTAFARVKQENLNDDDDDDDNISNHDVKSFAFYCVCLLFTHPISPCRCVYTREWEEKKEFFLLLKF